MLSRIACFLAIFSTVAYGQLGGRQLQAQAQADQFGMQAQAQADEINAQRQADEIYAQRQADDVHQHAQADDIHRHAQADDIHRHAQADPIEEQAQADYALALAQADQFQARRAQLQQQARSGFGSRNGLMNAGSASQYLARQSNQMGLGHQLQARQRYQLQARQGYMPGAQQMPQYSPMTPYQQPLYDSTEEEYEPIEEPLVNNRKFLYSAGYSYPFYF